MISAFLGPLTPGAHTVKVTGGVFGSALEPAVGITFEAETLTYTVNVL